MNALHLAAMCDGISCLSFYFDNNLLPDPDTASVELFTPMHIAAMCGSMNSMRFLCDRGANINLKLLDGSLPLHVAVRNEEVEAVEYLASHGSVMDTDNFGMSPMAYARQVGNQKIIDCLGSYSTFFTSASQKDTKLVSQAFESALLRADMQTCEELLCQGFCLDSELPGLNGHTPLTWAIEELEPSMVEWLLARDANAARCVDSGQLYISPLHQMVSSPGLNKILPVMLEKYQRDGGSILRETAAVICGAVYNNNNTGLRLLFNHVQRFEAPYVDDTGTLRQPTYFAANQRSGSGNTSLHIAAINGNVKAATLLLEHGANVDACDHNQSTALHRAASSRSSGRTLVAGLLLRKGAAMECRDCLGDTPLIVAALRGSIEVARLLINAGANLKASNYPAETALHASAYGDHSVSAEATQGEMFATLVQHGLNPHQLNTVSSSPVHFGMQRGTFASLLSNSDLRLRKSEPFPWHGGVSMVPMAWLTCHYGLFLRKLGLKKLRKLAHLEPSDTWAPLCIYASIGNINAVTNLLELGASLNFEGCPSGSALMAACSAGRLQTVRLLVRHGASISYHGPNGFRSAVDVARRNKAIVDWLLVGRFTDQKKISVPAVPGSSTDEFHTQSWSGPVKAGLVISGTSQRRAHESAKQYWVRLMAIKRDWRGKVVPVESNERTSRRARLIPEESVRVCPGDYGTLKEQ